MTPKMARSFFIFASLFLVLIYVFSNKNPKSECTGYCECSNEYTRCPAAFLFL